MENKNTNMLVIPDIHGRTFWKDAVKDIDKYSKVIFLGDYLDPYPFEGISAEQAIENFKEIVEFKRLNQDKVVLLLGNHDSYYYWGITGVSRYMYSYKDIIEGIFVNNRSFFQVAYETDRTLFTHAGYLEQWARSWDRFDLNIQSTAESLNRLLVEVVNKNENWPVEVCALASIPRERGGRAGYGSCIWADVHEHQWSNGGIDKYQVFGHTLQVYQDWDTNEIKYGKHWQSETFAMLDNCKAYIYNETEKSFIAIELKKEEA